jgi:hypothetical protein
MSYYDDKYVYYQNGQLQVTTLKLYLAKKEIENCIKQRKNFKSVKKHVYSGKLYIQIELKGSLLKRNRKIYNISVKSVDRVINNRDNHGFVIPYTNKHFIYKKRTIKGRYSRWQTVHYVNTNVEFYQIPLKISEKTEIYLNGQLIIFYNFAGLDVSKYTCKISMMFTGLKFNCIRLELENK